MKQLLDLAKDTAAAVRKAQAEAPEPPKEEKGKAALTELFNSVKNRSTPIIVERMVNEIDEALTKKGIHTMLSFGAYIDTIFAPILIHAAVNAIAIYGMR